MEFFKLDNFKINLRYELNIYITEIKNIPFLLAIYFLIIKVKNKNLLYSENTLIMYLYIFLG